MLNCPGPAQNVASARYRGPARGELHHWMGYWEHGNLWLAPNGLARIPLGWWVSFVHAFQGVDPALRRREFISQDQLERAIEESPRTLWLAARDMQTARLHSGILNDRVRVQMLNGTWHKLLWVRNRAATQRLDEALRGWLDEHLIHD